VGEADDDRRARALDPVDERRDLGGHVVGDGREPLARLEREQQRAAHAAHLLAGGAHVLDVRRVHRDVGERHGDPGVAAEQVGVLGEGLLAPVGVDAEERAVGGDGVGRRAGDAGGQLGRGGLAGRASGEEGEARGAEAGDQGDGREATAARRGGHRSQLCGWRNPRPRTPGEP
jgi:hypothetical protein